MLEELQQMMPQEKERIVLRDTFQFMGFGVRLDFPIIFFSEAQVKMRPFSVYCGLWQKPALNKHLLSCMGHPHKDGNVVE